MSSRAEVEGYAKESEPYHQRPKAKNKGGRTPKYSTEPFVRGVLELMRSELGYEALADMSPGKREKKVRDLVPKNAILPARSQINAWINKWLAENKLSDN